KDPHRIVLIASAAGLIAACASTSTRRPEEGFGASPQLPAPKTTLIPTVHVAKATVWADGAKPTAAPGLAVDAFAVGLDHPRWLYVLPNGDVLVAETDAPPKPDDGGGIRGFFQKKLMKKAGS